MTLHFIHVDVRSFEIKRQPSGLIPGQRWCCPGIMGRFALICQKA
jgi:hypothetical protein